MTQDPCPYCSLAKKQGELYCSRHGSGMANLKSGIFSIHAGSFEECDWHVTRLSLNFSFDDRQVYKTPSRTYAVSPDRYLLLNEGQSFKTFANHSAPGRMITIAFQVGLAEKLIQGLQTEESDLLDEPFRMTDSTPFLEKTYPLDPCLSDAVIGLTGIYDDTALDEALQQLLLQIVRRQLNLRQEIFTIKKSKPSTRFEIYKRLHWSLDYLHENFGCDIHIDDLAKVACLSTFHYKRLFTELFHLSPYQYIIRLRLEKACVLLKNGSKVADACRAVGWKDPSSFSRLFRKQFAITPEQYRRC